MKKERRKLPLLILCLFAVFTFMEPNGTRASDCYMLLYSWDCIEDKNFDKTDIVLEWKSALISKHKDHTIKLEGNDFGVWGSYYTSFYIDSFENFFLDNNGKTGSCAPFFMGYRSMYGFFTCRSGSTANKMPGCWMMMKLKPKDCPWIHEGHDEEVK